MWFNNKGLLGIIAIWTIFLFELSAAKNSYIFIAPNVVRPGRVFSIQGELLNDPLSRVILAAELKDGANQVARTEITVTSKQGVNLDLTIPKGFKASSKTLRLTVTGSGGLTFSSTRNVDFEDKSVTVYIQTDKSVYKPGQTIHMRVFGTTPELAIVNDKLKVEIHDPKGNKINQWDVSGFELNSFQGVYVQEQVLSDHPILGEWKIKARLLSYGTEFTEKVIKVDEYVLPKFEVDLDLPSFGRTEDVNFEGKVKAKYTFGKPVKGEASLLVTPKNERFKFIKGARVDQRKKFEMTFPIDGQGKFTIPMTVLKDLDIILSGSSLLFKVNVTETLTKSKQSDEQELSFYSNPIKIEFPKSLPDTFKPEMTYDVAVKISLQDGSPPELGLEKMSATIKEYGKVQRKDRCWGPRAMPSFGRPERQIIRPCGTWTEEKVTRTYTKTYDVPVDGVVSFPLKMNKKVTKVVIEASYKKSTAKLTLKKRHSPSDSYIQITTASVSAQAGQTVDFNVRSTRNPGIVNYQVYSKGIITMSGTFQMNSKSTTWSLLMTASMAPRAQIIVYYIHTDGEVVADALTINVQGIFRNKVTINFNRTDAMPTDSISLNIAADVNSRVHVLAVDKSVLLLGTGNDISSDQVLGEVNKFNTKSKKQTNNNHFCDWFCWRWPLPSGGEDVKDVFDDAGVIVITDANLYEHREVLNERPFPRPMPWFRRRISPVRRFNALPMAMDGMAKRNMMMERVAMATPVRPESKFSLDEVDIPSSQADLAPVQKVRKLFPEKWLWKSATVPANGVAVIEDKVPDTITSWIATAFGVHPESGFGLSQAPAQLQVALQFFMIVTLPYSVVRGEKVIVQVNLHNYSPDPLFTRVELSGSTDFDNLQITGNKQSRTSIYVARTITVAPNEVAAVYFPIVPVTIGTIDLSLKAQTTMMADAVVKTLLVEAEGSPREYNLPVLIDLDQFGTYKEKVKVEFPSTANLVAGSERVTVSVIGDIMGPTMKGLGKLLKMPYGCGEQNMLNFAPNIFVVKYMEATNNIDPDVMKDAKDFMEKGYQRELTYSHPDGSYSAFGSRDSSGSTWLTAFVLKSFVQAKPYIFIDDEVVVKAMEWLISQQNVDGTFKEPGRVIHKSMQGGSTGGKISLTSYVLIALTEARIVSDKIQAAIDKSRAFLEGQILSLDDVYDMAIVSYALQLSGSLRVQEVLTTLNTKAIITGGMKHWEKNIPSKNIELSAYVLLTLSEKQDRIEGVKILKWLTKQRNSAGGFMSTQDTVVALQGLAEMAALLYRQNTNLDVTLTGLVPTQSFRIDSTNAMVLQMRDLPSNTSEVTVTGTGHGLGLVQIGVFYNIKLDGLKDSFMLKVTLPRQSMNSFDVQACASWSDAGSSSMAVIEIGSPSGFVPDPAMLFSDPTQKKEEVEARKIVLYYDEITARDTCVTITMQRIGLVAGAMPVPVRVYDYYEPNKQVTEFYVPDVIKNSDVCDVCGTECDFCSSKPV